ncbi:hypothetical protein MES5069_270204 [Mesorhizobium escarrei]|uniref:Uncharacterized protein n=1 Tax=Mesorhizobium escarrei TaxID=666018 RepID=A0ABM9DWC2_9HYPH|nr:hypothetical protein MES5069_270204 [Mesorhizobium escarrei]
MSQRVSREERPYPSLCKFLMSRDYKYIMQCYHKSMMLCSYKFFLSDKRTFFVLTICNL